MADEVITVPAPTVEAAPVAAPAESAPIVETVPSLPLVEATPVSEPAPTVVETKAETPKPLLDPEAKEAKAAEAVVETPKPEAEPAPLPVYEFKLPEGSQTENPLFKSFNAKLGEFQNLSKTEQAAVQKFGQEMIDMHLEDVKAVVEHQNKSAWDWFKARNGEWLENSKKDQSIGGDNWDKTVSAASQSISLYGGTKAQQLETAKLLQETGVENHPAMLRFLSNITKVAAKEGAPVSHQSTPMQKPGIAQAMYGGSAKGAA